MTWRTKALIIMLTGFVLCVASAVANEVAPVTVSETNIIPIIDELPLTGTVTSESSAALSPRVSGLVSTVHVDAGDRVEKGAALLKLDPTLAELELQRIEATVAEARIRLIEAERLRDEARELVDGRNIAVTQMRAAEAEAQIRAAIIVSSEAERRRQAEVVERHTIIAPFAGVISRKLTEAGEWVETGTSVLELIAINRLRLDVQVPQERFHAVDTGTTVEIRLDAMPEHHFDGRLSAKVPVNDPTARTFLARVLVDNPAGLMTPGMSAQALFRIETGRRGLVIPRDALVRQPDGSSSVWIVNEGDNPHRVSQRQVQLGRTLSAGIEIREGLKAGQRVVIRGNETLSEGQRVRVLENS